MNETRCVNPERTAPSRAASLLMLLFGLLLLAGIGMSTVSCGTEDLTFPGQIPFTDTPGPTGTPTVTPTP
jgi:hypothetical protein